MPVSRRFLIAPSLTRLIRKELGWDELIEGHFPPQANRQSHVRTKGGRAHLVLTSFDAPPESADESVEVPMAHAEGLLQVCPGTLKLERSVVPLSGNDAHVERFTSPGPLDLVTVEFVNQLDAACFLPPIWFGEEVTSEETYMNRVMALSTWPSTRETIPSNAALEAVLDILEDGKGHSANRVTVNPDIDDELFVPNAPDALEPGLPRITELDLTQDKRAVEVERRTPVLQPVPDEDESDQERLESVIKGLSATLSSSSPEECKPDSRSRGRWSRVPSLRVR